MDYQYLITPFLTWLICGILKFLINSIQEKRLAFDLIGYGGMPSNHSAIVSSMVFLIALKEGISHPAFGACLTFAFIVVIDAISLRKQIGKHAEAINHLNTNQSNLLRIRIGHTPKQIFTGIIIGLIISLIIYNF